MDTTIGTYCYNNNGYNNGTYCYNNKYQLLYPYGVPPDDGLYISPTKYTEDKLCINLVFL